ncbi:MAG: Holliday junction resolvase RuvX [Saprospiraceae bacterium]|nr:Holliday junction resolvase RuvX [Saprospiraceae bacterium]
MARALGIDYGLKRTGLSVTDPLRICVNPLPTIPTGEIMDFIEDYLKKEKIDLIVLGDPYHRDGTPTDLHVQIHTFAEALRLKYPEIIIDFHDEKFTSIQAVRSLIGKGTPKEKRNKSAIDQMSAVLILQGYLKHY